MAAAAARCRRGVEYDNGLDAPRRRARSLAREAPLQLGIWHLRTRPCTQRTATTSGDSAASVSASAETNSPWREIEVSGSSGEPEPQWVVRFPTEPAPRSAKRN